MSDDDYYRRKSLSTSAGIGGWCLIAAIVIVVIVALSGCSLRISHTERAEGWPDLKPVVLKVDPRTLGDVCSAFGSALQTHEACTIPLFSARLCLVFVDPATMNGKVPGDSVSRLEHELMHCRGHEHEGGTEAAQLLAAHRLWTDFVKWKAMGCTGVPAQSFNEAFASAMRC